MSQCLRLLVSVEEMYNISLFVTVYTEDSYSCSHDMYNSFALLLWSDKIMKIKQDTF